MSGSIKLGRYSKCDMLMPIPLGVMSEIEPCIPLPLNPIVINFDPNAVVSPCVPAIVQIHIGNYNPKGCDSVGMIVEAIVDMIPSGYLKCNGQELSRTMYPLLYSAIGTYYGDGDQSTTFNIPNLSNSNAPSHIYMIKINNTCY